MRSKTYAGRTGARRADPRGAAPERRPSGGGAYRRGESFSLNRLLLILSVVLGLAAWIVGAIVYEAVGEQIPRMFLIGILFAILAAFLMIGAHLVSVFGNVYEDPLIPFPDIPGAGILLIVIGIAAVFGLGSLFQWIYGLNSEKQDTEPTSYIFVIDDSGSTAETDPLQLRYGAIASVLEDVSPDFPYMIYSFASTTSVIREMGPVSDGIDAYQGASSGGTAIRGSLNQVLSDYESGRWEGGTNPKVILLTDGYATDCRLYLLLNKTLKQYNKEGISISTVGLGDVDENMMRTIADSTGGVFISVSDANMLSGAMAAATTAAPVTRDLLSVRAPVRHDALYAVLRIVFISVLGVLLGGLVCICYGYYDSAKMILISSAVKAVLGALVMELGTGVIGMTGKAAWFLLWLILALTIAIKPVFYETRPRGGSQIR